MMAARFCRCRAVTTGSSLLAAGGLLILATGCASCRVAATPAGGSGSPHVQAPPAGGDPPATAVRFTDVTSTAGIRFRHQNSRTPRKYMIETFGSGGAFLDFDDDGW